MDKFSVLVKKLARTLILLAGCLVFFAGCARVEPEDVPDPVFVRPAPRPHPDAERMEGRTVITYAAGRDGTAAAQALVDAFNNYSETVFVLLMDVPFDVTQRYYEITLDFESGEMTYDVFDMALEWAAEFADMGIIAPIDAFVNPVDLLLFFQNSVNALRFNGSLWGMPIDLSANLLYFRSDAISRPPQTWNELMETAASLQGAAGTSYGLVMNGRSGETLTGRFLEILHAHGGMVLAPNGANAWNSTQTLDAINMLNEMLLADYTPFWVTHQSDLDAANMFANGESVYLVAPTSVWPLINNSAVRYNFAAAQLPRGTAGSFSTLNGTALAINAASENAAAAWEFIRFAAGEEGQRILAVEGSRIPARSVMINDRAVIAANPHFTDPNFLPILQTAVHKPATPHYRQISNLISREIALFTDGIRTAEEVVSYVDEGIELIVLRVES